ncbi:MAG: ChaN family lipoprotein, partial [Pyrinomonadaceae bacterium]|nr:ChaN family lipoprotein [Pyrinomonadaceae bacterium]
SHSSNLLDAQTLWDATMADSIAKQLKVEPKSLIIHLNGSFHSESRLGTPEQLIKYSPKTDFLVVTMRPEADLNKFDKSKHENIGDFVILTVAEKSKKDVS